MNIRSQIPNLLTLGNLVCGAIAALHISQSYDTTLAVFLIFLAAFFDLLDGAIARALGVSGDLGKQLDSLADVVSFGVVPAIIIYKMLEHALPYDIQWLKYLAFINAAGAAMRLARFNISTDQTHDFKGMPSPANGIFWASILAVYAWNNTHQGAGTSPILALPLSFTLTMAIVTSWLMVSNIRMFSFKFKSGGISANIIPYLFIVLTLIIAAATFFYTGNILITIPLSIILYIVLSIFYHILGSDKKAINS